MGVDNPRLSRRAAKTPGDRRRILPTVPSVLSPADIESFEAEGFVVMRGAVPRRTVEECWSELAAALRDRGVDPDRRETWTAPVVRLDCPFTPAFAAAGTQPRLWEAYDQLLGAGTWMQLPVVGGTVPVRFPVDGDPGDAGWHVDASFAVNDQYGLNVNSRGRGLLCLFLFSDVGPDDAPTEIKVGSHLDVPPVLEPFGPEGTDFITAAQSLPASTFARRSAFATGAAGDVYICHPFLVHRATWPHRGDRPRAIAQPGIPTKQPFALDRQADPASMSPVERAIVRALAGSDRVA
jgi:hypothetical protein